MPGELRGRVMAMYALLFVGTTLVGSMLVGTLAERDGIQVAIIERAMAYVLGTAVSLLAAVRMRRRA